MLRRLLTMAAIALASAGIAVLPVTPATAIAPTSAPATVSAAAGPCPYDGGHPELRQGSTQQEAIRHLQCLLREVWRYGSVVIDSSFGPATRSAVIAHQRDCGILPDGIVGPMTWSRLHPDTTTPACRD